VITVEDIMRFNRLRHRVFRAIQAELREDGHCKSYEGAFSIHAPNYFGELGEPKWTIEMACYVLGPNRSYEWTAPTFAEALTAAEKDVAEWLDGANYYDADFEEACVKAETKALQARLVELDGLLGAPTGRPRAGSGA
jgi:hypothetical protein